MNKKNILASVSVAVLTLPVAVMAQLEPVGQGGLGTATTLQGLVHLIEKAMGLIFGAIAVIMFLTAGILFLTAQGQPEKIATARQAFIWGVAGVVVGLISFSIVQVVSTFIQ